MLGIADPMRSNFAMMREMSNRKRFDSDQGGASVETSHNSINPPHHVDMPKNSKSPSDIQKKGKADQRISPMGRIE
ncbi:hypothetical protein TNCV_956391 [Trichonephila clavipes]|nr:hypothetical protein TNCV_956391 [Trichonephila clavipes]